MILVRSMRDTLSISTKHGVVLGVALLALAFGDCSRVTQGPAHAAPAIKQFKVGKLDVTVLVDAYWIVPNDGSVLGDDKAAASKVLAEAGEPTDEMRLAVNVLLVRTAGHVVLIDTGVGPKDHGELMASLALAGVRTADVTDVFITHGHTDHIGGLVGPDGKSAFPNAAVRLSVKEWAAMQADPEIKAIAGAIAGKVKPFEPGTETLPGITPVALYGHTSGHTGYVLASDGVTLEDVGDMTHSVILSVQRPEWRDTYDGDIAAGRATRVAELKRLSDAHAFVYGPHFPFPGVGYLQPTGENHYIFKPALP